MAHPGELSSTEPVSEPPRNREADLWRTLLLLIESGEVVPIVGRELLVVGAEGAERNLGDLLAERVAARLEVPVGVVSPGYDALNAVACRFLADRGDPRQVYIAVFEEATRLASLGVVEPLRKLAEIDTFKLFVTTTFDDSMKHALNAVRFGRLPRTKQCAYGLTKTDDLPPDHASRAEPFVFHLLGHMAPTSDAFVVTEEDALEFVHSLQTSRPTELFKALRGKDLLVIGCRFPSWLVRSFIRIARSERLRQSQGRTVFLVDTGAREDTALVDFLGAYQTRTEVFRQATPIDFVNELHRRWLERRARAAPAEGTGAEPAGLTPGAIFISYASEDREVAHAVFDALTAASLDVWFDRDQLMTGDNFEDKIEGNIRQCGLFVPILSRNTVTRSARYFRLEWKQAIRRQDTLPPSQRFIFPIRIDDLPHNHQDIDLELRKLDWLDLTAAPDKAFVDAVKAHYREHQVESPR